MEKTKTNQKRLTLFRLIGAIASFGFIFHMTHRECSRFSDEFSRKKEVSENKELSTQFGLKSAPSEVFSATAYCIKGTTRTGARTMPGLVSADPKVIPLGSIIHVDSPLMGGIYQVLDTGDLIKGKIIDIFIPSYEKCKEFGRRIVTVKVLRYGFQGEKTEEPKNTEAK
jgi:3D (Asp-Asp-Asp) domain-containing protein